MAPSGFVVGGGTIEGEEDAIIVLIRTTAVTEVSSTNSSSASATQAVNGEMLAWIWARRVRNIGMNVEYGLFTE